MIDPQPAIHCARGRREQHLAALKEVLAIPSISTLPAHKGDVERTASWIAEELRRIGISHVEIMPTGGHPIVYAEQSSVPGKRTVLVYGHYDVQPADPMEEWVSPPFEATVRGDNLYARGASDMKGQMVALMKAVECLTNVGDLPVHMKFLFEGEEEIGSPHLAPFIRSHRELFGCDVVLNCDSGILRPDLPAIVYALRGLAYFEIEVRGPKNDLHSGMFGGTVHNPAQVLCELIAGMHDADGRVTLPHFYDDVLPLSKDDREALARLPGSDDQWRAIAGTPALWGESGYSTVERAGARPTLDVNGIVGGFAGEGSKTVLPAKALAKISMRLVPNQDAVAVAEQLRAYLREKAPPTVTWEVREMAHCPPAVMRRDSPAMHAAVRALKDVFGVEPLFKREGGSVPAVAMLHRLLGVDTVMLGFALPDDGFHGPNEKLHLPNFFRGIETYIRFLGYV